MFDRTYRVDASDKRPFGTHWVFKGTVFEHGKPTRIAVYRKNWYGQTARVYVDALPARFYEVRVGGRIFCTGSTDGMAELAADMAKAISTGMLTIREATRGGKVA